GHVSQWSKCCPLPGSPITVVWYPGVRPEVHIRAPLWRGRHCLGDGRCVHRRRLAFLSLVHTPVAGAGGLGMNSIECRLCGGASKKIFSQTILQRYVVGYYRCDSCWSLQTEEPYWLGGAHAKNFFSLQ